MRRLFDAGEDERCWRLASCLRLAEQLERDRAQLVRSVQVEVRGKTVTLTLLAQTRPAVSLWAAGQEAPVFERAFGRRLRIVSETPATGDYDSGNSPPG